MTDANNKDGAITAPSYDVYAAVDIIAKLMVIVEGRVDRALAIVELFKDQFDTYQALFNQLSHNNTQLLAMADELEARLSETEARLSDLESVLDGAPNYEIAISA